MFETKTPEISVRGASGARYPFKVYPWGTNFKPLGGVYLVLRLDTNGKYTLIYTGLTSDLSERFDDHHKHACFNRHRKTHIAVHVEASEQRRLAIETDIVRVYNPPCNG